MFGNDSEVLVKLIKSELTKRNNKSPRVYLFSDHYLDGKLKSNKSDF